MPASSGADVSSRYGSKPLRKVEAAHRDVIAARSQHINGDQRNSRFLRSGEVDIHGRGAFVAAADAWSFKHERRSHARAAPAPLRLGMPDDIGEDELAREYSFSCSGDGLAVTVDADAYCRRGSCQFARLGSR